ncbi:MAG: molybdopterin molybdotransferase MoeA [Chlorobi bacterium]|nr:molybdopterin molybdotransferase MoeA [Chlorobiota bacterium]
MTDKDNPLTLPVATVLNLAPEYTTVQVSLEDSLHRILQEDIFADSDIPPFDKSAMDGYACRKPDLGNPLECIGIVQAGIFPKMKIGPGQCVKIMTGAAVPEGAGMVFKLEDADILPDGRIQCTDTGSKRNICNRGEDVRKGDILITKGTLITSRHIPVLAGAGYDKVIVARHPVTGIIANGTELVEPGSTPQKGQIRNSNSYQLAARLHELSVPYKYFGIAPDISEALTEIIREAGKETDILLVTGGASNSDFDLVPGALTRLGYKLLIRETGMKPGNPMTFATRNGKVCFGLSGNPVSSYIQFEVFVKPFIMKFMGMSRNSEIKKYRMGEKFTRKNAGRFGFHPVRITKENEVFLVEYHGSAHIRALTVADGLIEIEAGKTTINKGDIVNVRPF